MLCKIIYQVPAEDSKKLSDYVLANMEKQSLEYLNICAQKNNLGDSHLEKLGLAIELDLQSQASHYLTQLQEQGINFAQLCQQVNFAGEIQNLQKLCKYSGETECEQRVKELAGLEISQPIELPDIIKFAIVKPELFEEKKSMVLRAEEAERQRRIRMQRPAILRLLEATDQAKVQEILINEFSDQSQVDFYEISEQMEAHEVSGVGSVFTEYILQHYQNAFQIS